MRSFSFRPSRGVSAGIALLLLAANVAVGFAADTGELSTNRLWQKIVMVGASASAGFTVSEPFGGTNTLRLRLSRYVDAAVVAPREPVLNLAHAMFFLQPELTGRTQMTRALKEQPSLLLGVDFLFWFCYGKGTNDNDRLLRFEEGLKLLEPVTCPLVLGDIPDASAAVNIMLRPDQIPSTNAMAAANARLNSWAAPRSNVCLVPLSQFIRAASRNESITVHGLTLPAGKTRMLLQADNLHPSPSGTAAIALAVLGELRVKQRFPESDVRWDLAVLVNAVRDSLRSTPNPSPQPAGQPEAVAR